jgi:competence protein ComEA
VDPNATPWRVLEDPVEAPGAAAPRDGPSKTPAFIVARSTVAIGAAAVALAIGAFALAVGTSSGGSVVVDGGADLPGVSSGAPGAPGGAGVPRGTATGMLVVEIVGAVDHPGVYSLAVGARIGDLVTAAGGYGPRVDTGRAGRELNLAAPLHDGEQIRVPSRDDASTPAPAANGSGRPVGAGGAGGGPIDLNRATADELDTLPGIGPATAAKILAARKEQAFASVDDLRSRKLVGEKTFANLKDLVMVQ